jgi:PhnO protein
MEEKITVGPALPEHAQAVYGLMCELEGSEPDKQGFQSVFEANLKDGNVHYFAALLSGKVIGFSSLHVQRLLHHTALIGEIQEIVVNESCRGRGIGQMLFERMKEAAANHGCVQLEVCCRKERKRSLEFYQKMGMECSHFKLCLPLGEDA